MVSRRKVISSPHRRPISTLTTLPPTFRLAAQSSPIPQPFLKCLAPSAADRSRDEAGKSRRRVRGGMRRRRWYRVPRRPRLPPSASIAPVAQHRGGNTQLACDPAQRPTAAPQQGYRFPLELIRKMTPSLAHSTPFRSRRSLAKVSTNSREAHLGPAHPRSYLPPYVWPHPPLLRRKR